MRPASTDETNSANPKSPPSPSSGVGASPSSGGSAPPSRKERVPSSRAMKPSTLMPRKTDPMKGASMWGTLPHRYDDSATRGHRFPGGQPDDGVAGSLDAVVVGHADDHTAAQRRAQVADQGVRGGRVQVRGRLVEQDDVAVGQ